MAGALKQARFVVEGLEVDAVAMRRNIDLTGGLVMSEAVMMGLGPYIGREYAHDLVYDLCRERWRSRTPLLDLLAENKEITGALTAPRSANARDPANYLGQSGVMVRAVFCATHRPRAVQARRSLGVVIRCPPSWAVATPVCVRR